MLNITSEVNLQYQKIDVIRDKLDECGLRLEPISRRGWIIGFIDDKNIFDSDAENLVSAMKIYSVEKFYAMPARAIIGKLSNKAIYLDKTVNAVEEFQRSSPILQGNAIAYEDIVFFDETCQWLVFRTSEVRYTAFVGNLDFVMRALGKST